MVAGLDVCQKEISSALCKALLADIDYRTIILFLNEIDDLIPENMRNTALQEAYELVSGSRLISATHTLDEVAEILREKTTVSWSRFSFSCFRINIAMRLTKVDAFTTSAEELEFLFDEISQEAIAEDPILGREAIVALLDVAAIDYCLEGRISQGERDRYFKRIDSFRFEHRIDPFLQIPRNHDYSHKAI